MFTGIIEEMGEIIGLVQDRSNWIIRVQSNLSNQLKIDQSLAHDGICLTVVDKGTDWHEVVAVHETLNRTALGSKKVGSPVNLERAMLLDQRLDGHMVQGHIDATGELIQVEDQGGSHLFTFQCTYPDFSKLTVNKGSITVNGVSLTLIKPDKGTFEVAIIPYTFQHTSFSALEVGDLVNIEFDIIGKYISRQVAPYL